MIKALQNHFFFHLVHSETQSMSTPAHFCLKYTLLLYVQEEERGIVGAHALLWLISKCGVIQDSNWTTC